MMAAACGFSSASSCSTEVTLRISASCMPLVTASCVTVAKKTETTKATTTSTITQPRKVVNHSTEPKREPKKVAESVTKSSREVTTKDINNNSKAMKRSTSESLVVVTKKKSKRQTCFMTGCGLPAPSLKKHVVQKNLTLVFVMWEEMPREECMFFYNSDLSGNGTWSNNP